MPIRSSSPMERAQTLYERVLKECISYESDGAGLLRPSVNFTALVTIVQQEFDSSQLLIQMLGRPSADANSDERRLRRQYGTWLLMAYIACYGSNPKNVRFLRITVPELYEAAVNGLNKLRE